MLRCNIHPVPVVCPGHIPGDIPPAWPPSTPKEEKNPPWWRRSPGLPPGGIRDDDGDGGTTQ